MSGGAAAGGAAAAAAAVANAIRASGVLVRVEPEDFQQLLRRAEAPLVVVATGGVFRPNYQYLMSYKGLGFFTKAAQELHLPRGTEVVHAQRIWIPG